MTIMLLNIYIYNRWEILGRGSDSAVGLIGLPLAAGGLGYRTWRSTADCAYLAAYMHKSHHFPKLFPHLADRFPPILDLVPAVGQPALAPSKQAEFASRAFVRIVSDAPLVRGRIKGSASVMKHTVHNCQRGRGSAHQRHGQPSAASPHGVLLLQLR